MPSTKAKPSKSLSQSFWVRIPVAAVNLLLAILALWLGMSIPSYFRSISPLVLDAAAKNTPDLLSLSNEYIESGQPGLALPLIRLGGKGFSPETLLPLEEDLESLMNAQPAYLWSGGPAPYYEQFLKQAKFLREDETALIPTLLPTEHRQQLKAFLQESPNRNVQAILSTSQLSDWQRFYPVYSTSGQPLEATLLSVALLEQASALPGSIKDELTRAIEDVSAGDQQAMAVLENMYLAILTIGRYNNWLQMKTLIGACSTTENLLFVAQAVQKDPHRADMLIGSIISAVDIGDLSGYLHRHGERGWDSLETALQKGTGAASILIDFDKPVYHPPGFWEKLPTQVHSGQQKFKELAESYPNAAIIGRVFAFGLCGVFMVGVLRILVLGSQPQGGNERKFLINLDSLVGSVLVTLLVWVLIEPGLLDFRPNELGTLQINFAQVMPDDSISTIETAATTMLDQVTILVLLLFFVAQLLVFIFGLLKISEIKRQHVSSQTKLHLLENEELLFDLGLYVGLGGTVSSLILVVLNVVDASLMAAYASTLFGIIFVAFLKIGFLRPFKRQLILQNQ